MQLTELLAQIESAQNHDQESRLLAEIWGTQLSLGAYTQAYNKPEHYWTGINAATLSMVLDNADRARDVANQVRTYCEAALEQPQQAGEDRCWVLATLGEAALNLHDWVGAENWYRQAYGAAPNEYGNLLATRRQARHANRCHVGRETCIRHCLVRLRDGPAVRRCGEFQQAA